MVGFGLVLAIAASQQKHEGAGIYMGGLAAGVLSETLQRREMLRGHVASAVDAETTAVDVLDRVLRVFDLDVSAPAFVNDAQR